MGINKNTTVAELINLSAQMPELMKMTLGGLLLMANSQRNDDGLCEQMTLSEFFQKWYLPVISKMNRQKEATVKELRASIKYWINYTNDPPLSEISNTTVDKFTASLYQTKKKNGTKLSDQTVKKHLGAIFAIMAYAGPKNNQYKRATGLMMEMPEFPSIRKRADVNGRTFVGPLKVIRRWRLEEGSFVGFGGDPKNEVEIAAKGKVLPIVENEEKMDPEFLDYLKNICGLEDVENIAPENLNVLERCFNAWKEAKSAAETNVEAECKDVEAEGEEPEKKDEEKTEAEEPEKKEDVEAEGEEMEAESEKKQTPVAASGRNPAFDLSSRKQNASTGRIGRPDVNKAIAIAMLSAMGVEDKQIAASGGYSQNAMNEGLSSKYRNLTLKGMFCEAFEKRLGGKWTGRESGFAGKALQIMHNDSSIMASGGFSTISPLTIIQDILQLQYRAGFENFEGVAEKLSDINYNDNLMEAKMANYDIEGGLEEVGEDGEIQHGTLTSEEITTQVYTYANLLTLTEKMIINDRLDALSKLSLKQGRKAKIQRERAWFKEFMANASTLCTGGRGNKLTATLSIAGLSSAVDALASMETIGSTPTDPEFTELEGKFLLVPHALLPTAQTLFHDTKCDLVGLGEHLESNPHVNEYEPVSSTYFGAKMSAFGGSNTHWALFGDPAICPAMVISHLRGEEKPRIERLPVQPNILGYSFRTVYRYGVNVGDYRGVVYSDGTV